MLGLVLFVVLTGSIATVKYDQQRLRDQLKAEVQAYATALAQDFARLILVDAADQAADLVSKLKAFVDINGLMLVDSDGRVMLEYDRGASKHATSDDLIIEVPVVYLDVPLGQARFRIAQTRIQARHQTMVQLLMYFIPGITLLSVLLAFLLQRQFSLPLIRLTDAIRQVSRTHDYSLRLDSPGGGEYGELYEGFNDMMDRVAAASGALSDKTEQLQVTLESIGDGVLTTDTKGNVVYMNPVAERLCQVDEHTAIGSPITRVCRLRYPGSQVYQHPALQCIKRGSVAGVANDCNLLLEGDEVLPVQVTAAPIVGRDGELIGVITVIVDVSHARAMADELGYRASHDPLTDLLNRYGFELALTGAIEGARQRDERHAMLFLDLDRFKVVNDIAGHQAGDELLRDLARHLKTKVRAGDSLARMGGDEFAIVLRHCPLDRAHSIAEEIRAMVGDYRFSWNDELFDIGVSIGITEVNSEAGDASIVMSNADSACYAAKETGRNRVYVFRADDENLARKRGHVAVVSRIRNAVDHDRLVLHAQPIFTVRGEACGCEILVRMLGDQDQLLSPSVFLPAAERYGLIGELDRWVFKESIHWLSSHELQIDALQYCSVNVSGVSLGDPGFADYLLSLLATHPAVGPRLCIEITETSAIANLAGAVEFMERLADQGVRFALDDFGTGMSSLAYLKQLPVHMVKIDGAFVRDMMSDPVDQGMVRAINDIAQLTDKRTIAEFVENQASLDRLAELGVDYAQGYHLAKPQPVDELITAGLFTGCR